MKVAVLSSNILPMIGLITWSQFDISLFIGLRTNIGVADYKASSHGEEVNMGVDQGSVVQALGA